MLFSEKKKNNDYILIVGCGRLGAYIANALSNSGKSVTVLDTDKDAFKRLSSNFGGLSNVADGTDFDALKQADIFRATSVIAVTNHDNTNIMVAQIALRVFGVRHVIARLYDTERESVYRDFGIETICPTVLSAKEIDKILAENNETSK